EGDVVVVVVARVGRVHVGRQHREALAAAHQGVGAGDDVELRRRVRPVGLQVDHAVGGGEDPGGGQDGAPAAEPVGHGEAAVDEAGEERELPRAGGGAADDLGAGGRRCGGGGRGG